MGIRPVSHIFKFLFDTYLTVNAAETYYIEVAGYDDDSNLYFHADFIDPLAPTRTATITQTPTITFTPTSTRTRVPTRTRTSTRLPTNTRTITNTPTATSSPTATKTPTPTSTLTVTNSPTPTRTPGLLKAISLAAQDGWVLESNETSNQGGTMNTTATTMNLGDDAMKKQYVGLLLFNTGATLPDAAVITSTTLKIKKQGSAGGGDPLNIFQGLMVDIKRGLFGTLALQLTDFQNLPSKTYGPFRPALSGGWYSINLTSRSSYINKLSTNGGYTQFRLRFKLDDNNNAVANYLSIYSGNAPAANRPQLIIQYYVP